MKNVSFDQKCNPYRSAYRYEPESPNGSQCPNPSLISHPPQRGEDLFIPLNNH